MWEMLLGKALTPNQAGECLGRCVHVGVARQILVELRARGYLRNGMLYASAYSGIDTFAEALDAELNGEFEYAHASESNEIVRRGLLAAWKKRGLKEARCYWDACKGGAVEEARADLFVLTSTCEEHSKKNHNPSQAKKAQALSRVWRSLAYVRRAMPEVVVVENVNEPSIVGPMTGMLGRLRGYRLEGGKLDPRETAKAPMARERYFWVLTRVHLD
jgi:site-specific DNA-cytosine methylase